MTEDELYEDWEKNRRVEVPEGEGYQLWENTSEGSPYSPVFKTLDELCAWLEPNASTSSSQRQSGRKCSPKTMSTTRRAVSSSCNWLGAH